MEKNQNFFDPYNFNMQQMPNYMNNQVPPDMPQAEMVNPSMYYEQQYMYYRYLTQMLDYKVKLREWKRSNSDEKK